MSNLVPSVQLKSMKKTHGGVLLLLELQAKAFEFTVVAQYTSLSFYFSSNKKQAETFMIISHSWATSVLCAIL